MCPFGNRAYFCDSCLAPKRFSEVAAKVGSHPGLGARMETATTIEETVIKQILCHTFFERLERDALFEGFTRDLAVRIADPQQVIGKLVTVKSEQRLGKTLLRRLSARKFRVAFALS